MPHFFRNWFQKQRNGNGLRPVPHSIFLTLAVVLAILLFLSDGIMKKTASASPVTENLWGIVQDCSFAIKNPEKSIDRIFNKKQATCQGEFADGEKYWAYTDFQNTNDMAINKVILEVRFSVAGWEDDTLLLQISNDYGDIWTTLETFDVSNPPPEELKKKTYDVSSLMTAPQQLNFAQIRIRGDKAIQKMDLITLSLDEAQLIVIGTPKVAASPTSFKKTQTRTPPVEEKPTHTPTGTQTLTAIPTGTQTPTAAPTGTQTLTAAPTGTQTLTPVPDSSQTTTVTPTFTITPSLEPETTGTVVESATPTVTPTTTLTPTETLIPVGTDIPGIAAPIVRRAPLVAAALWGTVQSCTGCTFTNPSNSIDLAFNDVVASTTAPIRKRWRLDFHRDSRHNPGEHHPGDDRRAFHDRRLG